MSMSYVKVRNYYREVFGFFKLGVFMKTKRFLSLAAIMAIFAFLQVSCEEKEDPAVREARREARKEELKQELKKELQAEAEAAAAEAAAVAAAAAEKKNRKK